MDSFSDKSRWVARTHDHELLKRVAGEADIPLPVAAVLIQRGYTEAGQVRDFLHPHLSQLPSPFEMKDMRQAVELLYSAISEGEPITVYADYDVDGATGAAVIILFLRQLGARSITWCQPNRLRDGYGLHEKVVLNTLKEPGRRPGLLITVDCGISDNEAVARLKGLGFTVIVTDHHLPPPQIPEADAILNPLQPGCLFPCKFLAGVGVAFYFMMGLRSFLHEKNFFAGREKAVPNLRSYLDLVALGTVSDMVPLCAENRILAKAGFEVMNDRQRPCMKAFAEHAGNGPLPVLADDIAYRFAPLLNASSRMDDAAPALEFLLTEEVGRAKQLLKRLEETNKIRRTITREVHAEAMKSAEAQVADGLNTLVLFSKTWHVGVIGIVASKLVNKFQRPAIVLTVSDGVAKGSGRSVPGIDIYEKISECKELLSGFGGHRAAVGLTLPAGNLPAFHDRFETLVKEVVSQGRAEGEVNWVDWVSEGGEIFAADFLRYYELLEPFGVGNPEPVFASAGTVTSLKTVGGGHLKYVLRKNGTAMEGIGFNFGHKIREIYPSERYEVVFRFNKNTFRGKRAWQMNTLALGGKVFAP